AGMLGQDLVAAAGSGGLDCVALTRAQLDITDPAAARAVVASAAPDAVVNCAAWSDVDGAESHEAGAHAVNAVGAGNLARAVAGSGAWTVHISSDYVFDGSKREPYVESDATGPQSAYGRSKLAGEQAVAAAAPGAHTIIRTSWLFGAGGQCFPATILRLASEREQLKVVDDQVGCPTFAGHLAKAILDIAEARPSGVLHVAGAGACSWFEFGKQIVTAAGLDTAVLPCSTDEMPRPATRPAYSVLGTERPDAAPALPDWRQGLEEYMALRAPAR
ncbi:MAG TPA: dTDP-4-dehydrorhamnose reductase, partial [Solirubrobacteraceae bacterium]|nr:dTDP-4-dehydrorhamnose reductase [Solirubrobacteraceae bacterium]